MERTDILIVGAGASGLAAAIEAKRTAPKRRVTLLERLDRPGKKLLLTGNGRCNLGNTDLAPEKYNDPGTAEIMRAYGDAAAFFRSLGVLTRADGEGRLYPRSNTAAAVLDALRFEATRLGAELLCGRKVEHVKLVGGDFRAETDAETYHAEKLILAAGGCACPKCGTDGAAFSLARELGHSVVAPEPALTSLRADMTGLGAIKGVRAQAQVRAVYPDGGEKTRRGEVQFGDGTVSGICVFDLAYPRPREVHVDFLPDLSREEISALLAEVQALRGSCTPEDLMTGLVHRRVAQAVLKQKLTLSAGLTAGKLQPWQLEALAGGLKNLCFPVTGVSGWDTAQVTAGGVPLTELGDDLRSLTAPGAFFCGECVNVHGDCGGYNLAWAWASGRCAGRAAAGEA